MGTPQLKEWYEKNLKEKGLEVVFVSSDKDKQGWADYYGEMPWLAIPYDDRAAKEKLCTKFGVRGIPCFVILREDGTVITQDGRGAVTNDPTGQNLPWG